MGVEGGRKVVEDEAEGERGGGGRCDGGRETAVFGIERNELLVI